MLIFDLVYLCILALLSPWLAWRSIRTGRYRHDLKAKLLGTPQTSSGGTGIPVCEAKNTDKNVCATSAKNNPTAWFHGVSVGEIHLLVTVIAAFKKRFPDWRVAVTSTTDTGLAEARSRFPNDIVIAFPFDFSWAVRRTLDAVKPAIILLAESEMWPGFLAQASKRKIPVVVINARMSPRSYKRSRRVAGVVRRLLYRHVTCFAVQSQDYADRLRSLGVPDEKLVVTGSVKYDGASGDRDTPKAKALREMLNPANSLVLLAGSTHSPEEEIVLRVFARLRTRHPQLKLILVPRHPDRFAEVAGLVEKSGIPFIRRSFIAQPLTEMPAIVLLDTVGELGAAWSLAHLGYTGGSLDGKRGGQSMIEPAGYGVPAVFGPHVWNFRDASRRLLDAGGAIMVPDEAGLELALESLIVDESKRTAMGAKAAELVRQQQGATERTLDVIANVM